jgi:hypothetical protein
MWLFVASCHMWLFVADVMTSQKRQIKLIGTIIEWNGMSEDASKFIILNQTSQKRQIKIDRNDN